MDLFALWGTIGIRTEEAFRQLDQVEQRVSGTANALGSKIQDVGGRMESVGKGMASMGTGMTAGLTAPIVGIAAVAGNVAMQVQKSTSDIATSLGVTGEEAEKLSKSAQAVWKQGFGENLEEVNSALVNVKQNMQSIGDGDELEKVTRDSLLLGKTFDADINEVTRAGENLMKNFGISSSKAYDLMAAGAQRGLNFSDEMFDNLAEYTPLFSKMGYSAEEMFGILERGSKAGVYNLDYVNDIMKEFGIRVKDGSKTTTDAMDQLSSGSQEVWKQFLAGKGDAKDVASTVIKELQAMDDQVKANEIGVGLFGTKWEDLEADAVYAMLGTTDAMGDYGGKMEQLAKDSETFAMKWESFKRTAQSSLIPVGTILLEMAEEWLPKVAKVVEKVANGFANMPEGMQKMVVYGGLLLAAIGPVLLVLGTIVSGLGAATSGVGLLVKSFGGLSGALLKLPRLAALAFGAFRAASSAGGAVDDLTDSTRNAGRRRDRGNNARSNPFAKLPALASKAVKGVGKAFTGLGGIIARIGGTLAPLLLNPVGLAVTAIVLLVTGIVYMIVKHWDVIKVGAIKAFTAIGDFVAGWVQTIGSAISSMTSAIVGFFSSAWQGVLSVVQTVFNAIRTVVTTVLSYIGTFISNTMNFILQVVQTVWNGIKSFITSALTAIQSIVVSVWNFIKSFITSTVNAIKSVIVTVFNAIKSFITSVMNAIKNAITTAWNTIKSVVTTVVNAIKTAVTTAFNTMKSAVTTAMSAVKSVVTAGFNAMKNAAVSAGNIIKSSILGAFNAIKGLASQAVSWGKDIMGGLVKGLVGGIKNVTSTIGNIASTVSGTFKKLLGIKSPSRVFKAFGAFIGEGLAIGMEKTAGLVAKASEFMGNAIVQPGPLDVPTTIFPNPQGPDMPNPGGGGAPTGASGASANGSGVTIQKATFQINVEKIHDDEDISKLRRAIQTVVTDDLFGMAVRNV